MGLRTLFDSISRYNDINLSGRGRIGSSKCSSLSILVTHDVFDGYCLAGRSKNILNLFLADPGFLDSIENAFLFRVLLSVAGFIWAMFRMAIPFSAVRFLSSRRAPSQAPAPDWGARSAHVACLQNVALVLFVITRKFVIRKSAGIVSSAMN